MGDVWLENHLSSLDVGSFINQQTSMLERDSFSAPNVADFNKLHLKAS